MSTLNNEQINIKFAEAVYREFKQKRYGLTPCCYNTLSEIKIKKELSYWGCLESNDLVASTDIDLIEACSNDSVTTVDLTVNQADLDSIITRLEILEDAIGNDVDEKDLNYVHVQSTTSTAWIIEHNLNKLPSVRIEDPDENDIIGEIDYLSTNKLIINFVIPVSGKAYLN